VGPKIETQRVTRWVDGVGLLAFAVTRSKLGRLDPDLRNRALAVIDRGADLEIWKRDNPRLLSKRRAMLDRARPTHRPATAPETPATNDTNQLRPPRGRRARLRASTARGALAGGARASTSPWRNARARRVGFEGTEVPSRDTLERLGAKVGDPIALVDPSSPDTRFFAFVMQRVDWQRADFRKVQTIRVRPGDDQAPVPNVGISWATLAERYRRRSSQ
jgi:hypothetical protein